MKLEKNIGIQKSAGKVKKFNYWYLVLQKIEFKKHDTPVALIRNDLIVAVLPTHNSQQKPLRHKLCPTKHAQYHNGDFHVVARIIRELKSHMIPYKFKCSHWW